jgi:hypothetical protein
LALSADVADLAAGMINASPAAARVALWAIGK